MAQAITPFEVPRFVPGEVLGASDGLGWKDVVQRSYRYRPLDVQAPPLDHYLLVRYRAGQSRMARRFEGRWTQTECGPGDLSLLTRAQASHWRWSEPIDVAHVYLSPALLSRVAADAWGRDIADVRLHDLLRAQDARLGAIVDALAAEAAQQGLGGPLYVEALALQLAVQLLRSYASVTPSAAPGAGRLAPAQLRRATEYIEAHLHGSVTIEAMAAACGLGVWTFSRHFKQSTGRAPHAYVIDRRIERACGLLARGELAIKQVAAACGFADQAHLTRVLHARLGTTPARLLPQR